MLDLAKRTSVIIPLWGTIHRHRVIATITSLRKQTGVDLEIVVVKPAAESLPESVIQLLDGVVDVSSDVLPHLTYFRNEGVASCGGDNLFFCDADILLPEPRYFAALKELLQARPYDVAACPRRRRILEAGQDAFIDDYVRGVPIDALAIEIFPDVLCSRSATRIPELAFRTRDGHVQFTMPDELAAYEREGDVLRESVWRGGLWGGGLLVSRRIFDEVGGYCEKYRYWGHEDADLCEKLRRVHPILWLYRSDRAEELAVLHLEHPISRPDAEALQNAADLRRDRTALPIDVLRGQDLASGASSYSKALAARGKST